MSHPQSESIGGYLGYIPRQGYSWYISGILLISLEYPLGYFGAMCGAETPMLYVPFSFLCDSVYFQTLSNDVAKSFLIWSVEPVLESLTTQTRVPHIYQRTRRKFPIS